MTGLTDRQRQWLLQDLAPERVSERSVSGRSFSYLEAWDVRRHLIRLFGPTNFSVDVHDVVPLFEQQVTMGNNKPGWNVSYRASVTLAAADATYTEAAVGTATLPDRGEAHDMALKTAESDALKRAAVNLGTQFGLSLYGGKKTDVVKWTLDVDRSEPITPDEPVTPSELSHGGTDPEPENESQAAPEPDSEPSEGIAYDLDPVMEKLRGTYAKGKTSAQRIQELAEIKMSLPDAALQQLVQTKLGEVTLERAFDKAASDAMQAVGSVADGEAQA